MMPTVGPDAQEPPDYAKIITLWRTLPSGRTVADTPRRGQPDDIPDRPKHPSRHRTKAILLTMAIVIAAAAMVAEEWSPGRPPLSPPPSTWLRGEEATYFDYVAPRLHAVIVEGDALIELSATKSRNVFALRRGQNRIDAMLDELDDERRSGEPPPRFSQAHQTYVAAAADMRAGIDDSRTAISHLDWDAVLGAAATFRQGVDGAKIARRELDAAAGVTQATLQPPPIQ